MVEAEIAAGLEKIERDHSVRVLFSCESGSRAWGFASPDSDYDVRFIYAYPRERYLSIDEPKETVEFITSQDLDYAGWDLRKALRLLRKSNPSLIEWIHSPIVYRDSDEFLAELRKLSDAHTDLARLDHHYASMARTNARDYIYREEIPRKKYLYVLRPLFCRRWIRTLGTIPPVSFNELVAATVSSAELPAIERLLAEKKGEGEMATAPRDLVLHSIIEAELELPEMESTREAKGAEDLDSFFRAWIGS
ncbi:nucleotidyltransferase domain-containing protein [bacterium]|nr:MAG: nucleotidyltransferase domain-containing protein [bacterium]